MLVCPDFNLQDKAKLKVRKQSDPIEPEAIKNMMHYAKQTIRDFRAFKQVKHILYCR